MNGNASAAAAAASKRKNRASPSARGPRTKGILDRSSAVDGVYNNVRFMHSATMLVGCVIQVHTVSGETFEGIFRTFSPQCEIVLEMAHKMDKNMQKHGQLNMPSRETVVQKLILKTNDVEMLTAVNADLEYATKDFFATDTAISKYNGQFTEKELEPWDGAGPDGEEFAVLDSDNANGWDPNDMFRTNEQQYGVQSTYDHTLSGYTMPLEKKNTDEYKKQEAKALKIASEIESSAAYRARVALENTDEDEKISAVVRPNDGSGCSGKYLPPGKRKPQQGGKLTRSTPSPQSSYGPTSSRPTHGLSHAQHSSLPPPPSSSSSSTSSSSSSSSSSSHGVHTTGPPPHHVGLISTRPPHVPHQHVPLQHSQAPQPQPPQCTVNTNLNSSACKPSQPHLTQITENEVKVNGSSKVDKEEKTSLPSHLIVENDIKSISSSSSNSSSSSSSSSSNSSNNNSNNNVVEHSRESSETKLVSNEIPGVQSVQVIPSSQSQITTNHIASKVTRKNITPKVSRDEETADLKKFKSNFKLSEEIKEDSNKHVEESDLKDKVENDVEKLSNTLKKSTLNPNAKEFVLNPNAKTFTPRSPSTQIPTPPRPHTPGAVMTPTPTAIPIVHGQHIFTPLPHQYVMSAQMSMSASSLSAAAAAAMHPAGTRPRKPSPQSMQQRPDFSPSMHVAAATGQPILASTTMTTPFVQYAPQGMVPAHGAPQHSMPYTQMYSIVPQRLMPAQGMTMVPAPHLVTHHDTQHVPSQMFVSAHPGVPQPLPPGPTPPHPGQAMTPGGPHTNQAPSQQGPLSSQGQVTGMHPNPSPVHGGNTPSQQTNPNALQLTAYQQAHAPMTQPPMQPGPHTPNSPQTMHPGATPSSMAPNNPHFHPAAIVTPAGGGHTAPHVAQGHPHPTQATFPGGPQQMVLIHQQGPGTPSPLASHPQGMPTHTLQGHTIHPHAATTPVTHLVPHTSMALPVIPATSASVPAQHQIFIQHHSAYGQPPPFHSYPSHA